ncbi:hypothetical protein WI36_05745 [Burkholderia ubonensis]|uniref:hypothetical protein n=1 Tax=Burkholderia ubonensis TaxID=101571 RepID=UPI000759B8EC|nr:hypothetical protein [Burkholderia ubonensis]KUZ81197.1 hypothetical protein WI36_05745 [Burkholderia ubonensis]KVR05290.1 hypothetical protein WK09_27855 [Burkholderia ubonensis]KWB95755.1 hypothetical protein WL43_32030 [Burkholderia ubonensis]
MSEQSTPIRHVDYYEGFEIHVVPTSMPGNDTRFTYTGYVCHPGANPALPGHAVPFHADGEESYSTVDEAVHEAVHIGKSIIDGTHPDLSVLSLVTHGY